MRELSRVFNITVGAIVLWGAMGASVYAKEVKHNPLDTLKYKAGQEKSNDVRAVQTELLVAKSEKKAIQQVQKLIRKYRGMAIEADMQLRLAELYMRRAKTERFFELNRESEVTISVAPIQVKKASSKKMIQKAIKIYDNIIRRFPNFDKIDVVTFNDAFARQQLGQTKSAEKLYWKVISQYSYSYLVPDSHLAIGEMAFRGKKFSHALDHFDAIKKYPNSRVYPYGLYKAGWTHYNLHNSLAGMKELEKVVAYGKRVESEGLDARLDLRKEALADMVLFFSDLYHPEDAYSYFSKQAKADEVGGLILRLSRFYKRHSKFTPRHIVLSDFINKNKTDVIVPEIYDDLTWNFEEQKNRKLAVVQLGKFHEVCEEKSSWSKFQIKNNNLLALKDCLARVQGTSIKLARKWLKIWRNNKKYTEFSDVAEQAFEHFLYRNTDELKSHEARFAYAELLFQRKKFRKASYNYQLVADHTKNKKIGHDSLYASIVSLEQAVENKWSGEDEDRYMLLAKNYVERNPSGKYRLDIEFKAALIAYDKGRYVEAAPVFKRLGSEFASQEKGLKSQDLYLDILNHNKDYKSLIEYSHVLLKSNKNLKRKEKLTKIYEQAYFLEVQQTEEKGKFLEAINAYKNFVNKNPSSKLAEKALWNVSQLFYKMGDTLGGAKASEHFYNKFTQSKDAKAALLRAAQSYESMGQLKMAANVLEKLSVVDADSHLKWSSLAADFYLLIGDENRATKIYKLLKNSKDSNIAFHALVKLKEISFHTDSKLYREYRKEVANSSRQPESSLAMAEIVDEIFKNKNSSKAFVEAKKILNMGPEASAQAKARARFIQAQILEEEFDRQSVKSSVDRFTMVFAIKTEKLEKAQRAYQATIRYGDPYLAIESLIKLSKLYKKYVEVLKTMPLPSDLPQTEEAAFRIEMDKLVMPMEEKSVDTMVDALNQARRLNLRNGIIAKIQWELDKLNMKKSHEPVIALETPDLAVPKFVEVGS